jgi:sigma-54 dependent transcriptional regulator, acetoin dehydrogenase operon transcriptional activator AcoR
MDHKQIQRAWERFVCGGATPTGVRRAVAASWQRSHDHDVVIERTMAPLAQEAEIYRHRSQCCALVNAAQPVFSRSSALLSDADAMLILTDTTGLILETQGDERVIDAGRSVHLEHGGRWREADIGTNAIGTAVAMSRPVQIHGAEHFCSEIQKWTCAASPVRHPVDNEVLGIVDISGPASKFSPQSLALAVSISHHIEDVLARGALFERERLLHRSLLKAAHWANEEMIVIDRRGAIVHVSDHALRTIQSDRPEILVNSAIPILRTLPSSQWPGKLSELFPHASVELVADEASDIGAIVVLRTRRGLPADSGRANAVGSRIAKRPAKASCLAEDPQSSPRRPGLSDMIADDPKMRAIVQRVERAATRAMPILILGETGTGKEQLARYAHAASGRKGVFVPVNCAALPESLVEAELFGYADGAFTGARRGGATGLVKQADGGTLFLDEIGDMPIALQAVLLRFLDDWTVRPIGGAPTRADIFLVSATNRPLDKAIADGRFRSDLLYRLNTLEVTLPQLSERCDFAAIARHLLASIDPGCEITTAAAERLAARPWPGNIRELRNILTRYTLTVSAGIIDEAAIGSISAAKEAPPPRPSGSLHDIESAHVLTAYTNAAGNISEVARRLGISRNTVYRILEQSKSRQSSM